MKFGKFYELDGTIVSDDECVATIPAEIEYNNRTIFGYRFHKVRKHQEIGRVKR
jgi:hypothetical protein